ncbi:class I mannose-6-phosphate isomerase [Acidicapsa dinghuensis]|uniref:Class I mannose-6-phosphate isomerase n=1 Tax=Acidicapsa dinghuensis TaxID=2218256 RepID=A0ABW1ENK7_9BACT|nr:class I mannose-6-phosphate isomerase [Acidicapsa dinghuensis]
MSRRSNYDKFPYIPVGSEDDCSVGWSAVAARIIEPLREHRVLAIECYPGTNVAEIHRALQNHLPDATVFLAEECLKSPAKLETLLRPLLGTDRVFGRMSDLRLENYFDHEELSAKRDAIEEAMLRNPVIVVGTGAAFLVSETTPIVYADLARWEIQLRWRRNEIGNLGLANTEEEFSAKYKCGYFVEWRAADAHKRTLLPTLNFLLDLNKPLEPKLITGEAFRKALKTIAHQPFRVVPYFDPGPWGGHWMEEVCDLPCDVPNHAWCFDCVPEENSLLLGFGKYRVQIPAIDLVFSEPEALLGRAIMDRFGAEFPIRFDLLDTMGGGNLSLQVHPLTEYIQKKYGMAYTQDESYYLLDAGSDACVYLGLKEHISQSEMAQELREAEQGRIQFDAEKYVNRWEARKHDHFLIPAGTIHCSGANSMVLEISATPYIFTFKLWDWGRLGLDGKPRPIHIEDGLKNIQWDRTTEWVRKELINRTELIEEGNGWREEKTGLHESEFIETRRHIFSDTVLHMPNGTVNVLNLVEGDEVIVESPTKAFDPFIVHYAETFIIPAVVSEYSVRPRGASSGMQCITVKAFVR